MVAINRLSMFAFILLVFHLIRKSLFPYINLERFTNKAAKDPIASSIVFAMIIIFIISLCYITVANAMTNQQILDQAKPTLPLFKYVVYQHWTNAPRQQNFPGTVEQETCASLKKCWNFNVQLKTSREYGFGLGQITIAYTKQGKVRFNNFLEAKKKYTELSQWQWDDRYNPTNQLIYMVLRLKQSFQSMESFFKDDDNRWAATLVSYNAGPKAVMDRIAVCRFKKGCDKTAWFQGLDSAIPPHEKKSLYGKPLYIRINEYPENIIHIRANKYKPYWDAIVVNSASQPVITSPPTVTDTPAIADTPVSTPTPSTPTPITTPTPLDILIEHSKQFINHLKQLLH